MSGYEAASIGAGEISQQSLQTTNRELAAVTERLEARIGELELARSELMRVLESSEVTLLVVDRQLRIELLASTAGGLFDVDQDDVGRSFEELDAEVSGGILVADIRRAIEHRSMAVREIVNRAGRTYLCRIIPQRVPKAPSDGVVLTVRDITDLKLLEAEREIQQTRLEKMVQRRTALIDVMHLVARAANRAATVEEVVADVLPKFCRTIGAGFGAVWLRTDEDPRLLERTGPPFVAVDSGDLLETLPARWTPSEGSPPDLVLEDVSGAWSTDLEAALGADRAKAAERAGLCRVSLTPIVANDCVAGLLEILHEVEDERRDFVADVSLSVATEIGRVVERVELQNKISDISDDEQRRIGQELHDTVAQEVAGIRLLSEVLLQRMEEDGPDRELVSELVDAAAQAQAHVRSLARGLVPVAIDAGGLREALEHLVERLGHEHDLRCEFENPHQVVIHDGRLATNLYYIAQEALRNAAQHGHARHAVVELVTEGRDLVLRIGDDGRGFDPETSTAKSGSGLRIMAYRARLVGGELALTSGEGDGTTVTCIVPGDRRRGGWESGT